MPKAPGQVLRSIRLYGMHITQAGLGRRIRLGQSAICRLERGETRMGDRMLEKLRRALSDQDYEMLKEAVLAERSRQKTPGKGSREADQ